jgi:hypothetical protein
MCHMYRVKLHDVQDCEPPCKGLVLWENAQIAKKSLSGTALNSGAQDPRFDPSTTKQ